MIAFVKKSIEQPEIKGTNTDSYIYFEFVDKYEKPYFNLLVRWLTLGSLAFIAHKYWQWFIVDTFDMPQISIFNMLGIIFTFMMFKISSLDYKPKPNDKKINNSVFLRITTGFWFFFLLGWVCKFFMGLGL